MAGSYCFKSRKESILAYEQYLKEIIALSGKIKKPQTSNSYPEVINTKGKRALFDNLGRNETLVIALDEKIRTTKKDAWRDNPQRTKAVELAVKSVLKMYDITEGEEIRRIFDLVQDIRNGF